MWHISIIITSADCSMMMHQSNSALRTPLINIILLYLTGNRWSHQILLSTFLNFGKDLLTVISLHWLAWKVDPVLIQNQLMVLERMETQKRKLNNWRRKQINALKVWLLFYMWYIFCSVNVHHTFDTLAAEQLWLKSNSLHMSFTGISPPTTALESCSNP